MKGLIIAVQFLTRLPTPALTISPEEFAKSMRWFPAAGLIIGFIVSGAAFTGALIDSWTGAIVALAAWVLVTGALHLDGLGDIADAVGASHGAPHNERKILSAVLADPHIGSFGVVAIALQLLAKLVLLHGVIDHEGFTALIVIPFAARLAPLFWARFIPPLHDGLGARFRGTVRAIHLVIWSSIYLAAAAVFPTLLVAIPAAILWGLWVMRRIGGLSGDSHGAGIEICETAMSLAVVTGASF